MQFLSKNKLKYIRLLHASKYRQKYNNFIVEGHKSCIEFLKTRKFDVEELVATEQWLNENKSLFASIQKESINASSMEILGQCSQFKTPPDVILILKKQASNLREILNEDKPIILLDDVQDPGNVGTILRIADWFGFCGVIRSPGSADFFNSKVVQASMGSLNNVKIATIADLEEMEWERAIVLDMEGLEMNEWQPQPNSILIMGNEGQGVSDAILEKTPQKIKITGTVHKIAESLNVGVTAGIVAQYVFKKIKE